MSQGPRLKASDLTPPLWPTFTDTQVAFLEAMYPPRCIGRMDRLEDHIRYAGMVDLIAQLREHVVDGPHSMSLTDDEEDALDEQALAMALGQVPNE